MHGSNAGLRGVPALSNFANGMRFPHARSFGIDNVQKRVTESTDEKSLLLFARPADVNIEKRKEKRRMRKEAYAIRESLERAS